MASLQEFLGAVGMFNRSMNQIATQRNISRAQEERAEIIGADLESSQKRSALKDLTAKTAGSLIGLGVDPGHINQMVSTLGPENFGSASEAILEGVLASKPELVEQGITAQNLIGKPEREIQQQSLNLKREAMSIEQANEMRKEYQAQIEAMGLNYTGKIGSLTADQRERFVPGLGLATDKKSAMKLREQNFTVFDSLDVLDELEAIAQKGKYTVLSKPDRAKADRLLNTMSGKLRVALTGGGPLTKEEREMLRTTVGDPTERSVRNVVFGTGLQGIQDMKRLLQSSQKRAAQAYGIQPLIPKTQRAQAAEFLRKNPNHPKAQQIKQIIGVE